jgi:hypothetical protein
MMIICTNEVLISYVWLSCAPLLIEQLALPLDQLLKESFEKNKYPITMIALTYSLIWDKMFRQINKIKEDKIYYGHVFGINMEFT